MTTFYTFVITVFTFVLGSVAYEITLTANVANLGGYLVFAFFTFSPGLFFILGRVTREPDPYTKRRILFDVDVERTRRILERR